MSSNEARPWLWLALALVPVLIGLTWWTLAGSPAGRARDHRESTSGEGERAGPSRARDPATVAEVGEPGERSTEAVVAATIVSSTHGNLGEGRVELRCPGSDAAAPRHVSLDEDGRFVAAACEGRTCVRLTHSHFEQPHAWELDAGREHELTVDLGLRIAGHVRTAQGEGEGISGASIIALVDTERRATTQTDARGGFELVLPRLRPCDVCDAEPAEPNRGAPRCRTEDQDPSTKPARILVSAPGFAPVEHEVAPAQPEPIDIELPAPAEPVSGRVVGRDGVPFTDRTQVLAVNIARELETHATSTDARGEFQFESLGEGHYRVRAVRDGIALASATEVEPGDEIELRAEVEARGHSVQVEVVNDQGSPLRDARVDGGPFRGAKTDEEGVVDAMAVVPGSYVLLVRAPTCPVLRVRLVITADDPPAVHERIELPACGG